MFFIPVQASTDLVYSSYTYSVWLEAPESVFFSSLIQTGI